MESTIVQTDFGGFNPRFVGVNIKFDTPDALRLYVDYITSDDNPGHATSSLADIAIRSVLEHEIRHYHDFLISPYSSQLFRLRFQAVANGVPCLDDVSHMPGDCLPVPLCRWTLMTEAQRRTHIEEWNAFVPPAGGGERLPVSVPVRSRNELSTNLPPQITALEIAEPSERFEASMETTVRAYMRIEELVQGFGATAQNPELRPANFYEATALTVQAQAIWQAQGEVPAYRFMQFLGESDLGYAKVWRLFASTASIAEGRQHAGIGSLVRIMSMAVWCLLGNYQQEGPDACPTVRFKKLIHHLLGDRQDPRHDVGGIAETWDHWDDATGVVPWRQGLLELLDFNQRGLRDYARLASVWPGPKTVPELIARSMEAFVAQQRVAVELLLAEPEKFVDPQAYLGSASDLPYPLVKYSLSHFAVPKAMLPEGLFRSVLDIERDGEVYSARFISPPSGIQQENDFIENTLTFEDLVNVCDLAFSNHLLPHEVHFWARGLVEDRVDKSVFLIV